MSRSAEPPAWLFDVYPQPGNRGLVVWMKNGERMSKRIVPYTPDFCVRAAVVPLEEAQQVLQDDPRVAATWHAETRLWLEGPIEPVLRVRPKRLRDIRAVASDLRQRTRTKGLVFYDVDHQPESRWMHKRGLFSMCRLDIGPYGPRPRLARGEDRWTLDYPDPDLSCARLEVTVEQSGHAPAFDDPLVAVRLGDTEIHCRRVGDPRAERVVLRRLGRCIAAMDPDVLLTRHGDRFEVPYLLRRIRMHGLRRDVNLGRDPDPHPDAPDQQGKSIHTYGRWLYKTHAYYLRGRWHIDLSKKTLDSEIDRTDLYGIVYLARVSNCRAQHVNRNGAGYALQQMQIDLATDRGVALPWKRNLAEDWKDAATLYAVDRGGQIMNPDPGIYTDVVACDFSGYYPSLVVTHNLSSDTINCTCCPDGPMVPELGYHVCVRQTGHQAEILRRIWPHRRYVKAILRRATGMRSVDPELVAKCRAIKSEHKALGVVCFGYFRYRNARFGCAEVHQAIQCFGRAGMTQARKIAQSQGFEMVHALTDCVFLHKPGITRKDALAVARAVTNAVGVPMDVEGVYKWIVLLPSKTHTTSSAVGVPNRYYGKFEDGTLKVRGIEVQRHSTCDWIYDAQQGMLDVLSQADDATGFLARIPRALQVAKRAAERLLRHEVPAEELGIMIQATRAVEDYRANTNVKQALRALRDSGTERKPGEYVKYVVARSSGPWRSRVVPVELSRQTSGWYDEDPDVAYDVGAYLRLLARCVETLFAPFGYSEEGVHSWFRGVSRTPFRGPDDRPPATYDSSAR